MAAEGAYDYKENEDQDELQEPTYRDLLAEVHQIRSLLPPSEYYGNIHARLTVLEGGVPGAYEGGGQGQAYEQNGNNLNQGAAAAAPGRGFNMGPGFGNLERAARVPRGQNSLGLSSSSSRARSPREVFQNELGGYTSNSNESASGLRNPRSRPFPIPLLAQAENEGNLNLGQEPNFRALGRSSSQRLNNSLGGGLAGALGGGGGLPLPRKGGKRKIQKTHKKRKQKISKKSKSRRNAKK